MWVSLSFHDGHFNWLLLTFVCFQSDLLHQAFMDVTSRERTTSSSLLTLPSLLPRPSSSSWPFDKCWESSGISGEMRRRAATRWYEHLIETGCYFSFVYSVRSHPILMLCGTVTESALTWPFSVLSIANMMVTFHGPVSTRLNMYLMSIAHSNFKCSVYRSSLSVRLITSCSAFCVIYIYIYIW